MSDEFSKRPSYKIKTSSFNTLDRVSPFKQVDLDNRLKVGTRLKKPQVKYKMVGGKMVSIKSVDPNKQARKPKPEVKRTAVRGQWSSLEERTTQSANMRKAEQAFRDNRNKAKGSGTRSTPKFYSQGSTSGGAGAAGLGGRGGARKLKL